MVRNDYAGQNQDRLFLDGLDVETVSEKLNCPLIVVKNPTQAESLIHEILMPEKTLPSKVKLG